MEIVRSQIMIRDIGAEGVDRLEISPGKVVLIKEEDGCALGIFWNGAELDNLIEALNKARELMREVSS